MNKPFFQGEARNTTLCEQSLRASSSDSKIFCQRSKLTPRLKTPIYGAADRQRQRVTTPGWSHRQLSTREKVPHRSLLSAQSSRYRGRPAYTPDPAEKMLSRYRAEKTLRSGSVFHTPGQRIAIAGLQRRQKKKRRLAGGFGLLPYVEVGDPKLRYVQGY